MLWTNFLVYGLQSESSYCGKDIKKEVRVEVLWLVKVDG